MPASRRFHNMPETRRRSSSETTSRSMSEAIIIYSYIFLGRTISMENSDLNARIQTFPQYAGDQTSVLFGNYFSFNERGHNNIFVHISRANYFYGKLMVQLFIKVS